MFRPGSKQNRNCEGGAHIAGRAQLSRGHVLMTRFTGVTTQQCAGVSILAQTASGFYSPCLNTQYLLNLTEKRL